MSLRAVSILAVLTALLVGYVLLFERESVTSKELEQRKGRVLTSFVRERVDRLELQRAGKSVVLERKPSEDGAFGSWKLIEPLHGAADQDAVDQVLGELEWLSARRSFEKLSPADEKTFGLSAPRYRVTYRVGGVKHMLQVGNADVHAQGVYVRTDEKSAAFVVPKTLTEALDHTVGHFRAKEFLGDIVVAWARSVELQHKDRKVTLTRDADRWWFDGTPRSFADPKRIDALLVAFDDLKAARYLEEGPVLSAAKLSLAQPDAVVRVRVVPDEKREDQEPSQVELRLGGACPDHPSERLAQAGTQGAVVCLSSEQLEPILAEPEMFRSYSLLGVDPSQVEGFELSAGDRKLAFKREGEKWISQTKVQGDREAIERWLASLAETRAAHFQPLSELSVTGRLLLRLANSKQLALTYSAATERTGLRVQRGDEPAMLIFDDVWTDLLEPSPLRFSPLTPWAERKPSEVVACEARAEGLARSLLLEQGRWRVATGKPELAADAEPRVRELVRSLIQAHALGFVAENARSEHELTTPRAVLTLSLRSAPDKPVESLRLAVGRDGPHGPYARFDSGPVFEVPPTLLAEIKELAGGPAAPPPPAAKSDEHDEEDEDDFVDPLHDHAH
jgi:hypothetical protein